MDAQQGLNAAHMAADEGRHAEALAHYVWFHRHALEEMPSLYGVRLSFALGYWKDLADVYPEALEAMKHERDHAANALRRGEGNVDAFHDVVSINKTLGDVALTHQLYVELAAINPELARRCVSFAMPAIVAVKDFALAGALMPDPQARIVSVSDRFNQTNRCLQGRPYSPAPRRWAEIKNASRDIHLVLHILEGCGRKDEASRLRALALKTIQSPSARRSVDDALRYPDRAPPIDRRELRKLERLHGKKK